MQRMRQRSAIWLSIGAQLRDGISRPVKRLLAKEKRKSRKQKIRPQKLKQNSRNRRRRKAICKAKWAPARTRSLLCKSESKKPRKWLNLRQIQLPPPPRNYRRNSMMLGINLIAPKKRKHSYPKNSRRPRSAPHSPRKRKNGVKQALENQAYAVMFLPSIRRIILWS